MRVGLADAVKGLGQVELRQKVRAREPKMARAVALDREDVVWARRKARRHPGQADQPSARTDVRPAHAACAALYKKIKKESYRSSDWRPPVPPPPFSLRARGSTRHPPPHAHAQSGTWPGPRPGRRRRTARVEHVRIVLLEQMQLLLLRFVRALSRLELGRELFALALTQRGAPPRASLSPPAREPPTASRPCGRRPPAPQAQGAGRTESSRPFWASSASRLSCLMRAFSAATCSVNS